LYVNGQAYGLYANVEAEDKTFLRRWFTSDDGNLYEEGQTDFVSGAEQTFDLETNETANDRSDLIFRKCLGERGVQDRALRRDGADRHRVRVGRSRRAREALLRTDQASRLRRSAQEYTNEQFERGYQSLLTTIRGRVAAMRADL
jgi:hypothetical protein